MNDINLNYSQHCHVRCQQRGIETEVIDFIVRYGKHRNSHNDKKYYVNKKLLGKLKHKHKSFLKQFESKILTIGVIVNERTVITAYRINKKFLWN